jgi:t-SNARE complex subunit (syntaxin)
MLTSIAQDLQALNMDINTILKEDQKKLDTIINDADDANSNMKDANLELQKKKEKMMKNFSRMACIIVFLVIIISFIPYI